MSLSIILIIFDYAYSIAFGDEESIFLVIVLYEEVQGSQDDIGDDANTEKSLVLRERSRVEMR
jgi:hypothetical protein